MAAAVCTLLLAAAQEANAAQPENSGAIGTLGPGRGRVAVFDLVYGNGTGASADDKTSRGSQVFMRFDGGAYSKASSIGNLAGVEFGVQIGWDGVPKRHKRALVEYMADIGMDAEVWLGFPVTLVNLGDGKNDWLRWSIAPGMGTSLVHGYFYLKSALALRLPVIGDTELSATWWPDAANNTYGDTNDTRNATALKLSLFRASGLHLFLQLQRTQDVTYLPPARDDPNVYGRLSKPPGMKIEPFALESRRAADSVVTIGVGWTPFTRKED